jgi:hypothetical protein
MNIIDGGFWPIADRVKQWRSSNNESGFGMKEINVTTGRLSLPPVEFKVTACHAMRGSGSTEINIIEGGAIPAVAMDDDVSAELRIGSDIIESNVTEVRSSVPPVEFKVTACHAMRGSGSTEINVMEGGATPAVAMDLMNVEQRGSGVKDGQVDQINQWP